MNRREFSKLIIAMTTALSTSRLSALSAEGNSRRGKSAELEAQINDPIEPEPVAAKPLKVAFLVYPGVEVLDLSGPLDVFVKANSLRPGSYDTYTVALEDRPITTQSESLTLSPEFTLQNCPRPDILVISGASVERVKELGLNRQLLQWLKNNATSSQIIMSVCTGAFLLGQAGLLNGRDSTTHWAVLDEFQRQFPQTRVYQGVRYVEAGNIVTAAGVSSGIDGALFLIEKTIGKQIAYSVARGMQYLHGAPAYPNPISARVALEPLSTSKRSAQKLVSDKEILLI